MHVKYLDAESTVAMLLLKNKKNKKKKAACVPLRAWAHM